MASILESDPWLVMPVMLVCNAHPDIIKANRPLILKPAPNNLSCLAKHELLYRNDI